MTQLAWRCEWLWLYAKVKLQINTQSIGNKVCWKWVRVREVILKLNEENERLTKLRLMCWRWGWPDLVRGASPCCCDRGRQGDTCAWSKPRGCLLVVRWRKSETQNNRKLKILFILSFVDYLISCLKNKSYLYFLTELIAIISIVIWFSEHLPG